MADSQAPKKLPQYIGALIVTLGGFCLGLVLAWSSPAEHLLVKKLGKPALELNWIFSILTLGCGTSALISGFMIDGIGRKWSVVGMAGLLVVGWLLLMFANSMALYCVGRFVSGFAGGSFSVSCPTYLAEMAHKSIRGQLGVMFQLQIVVGMLVGFSLGETENLWVLNGFGAVMPVVLLGCMMLVPESPVHLVTKGREEAARNSLTFFRGKNYPLDDEMKELSQYAVPGKEKFCDVFKQKATLKGFGTLLVLHAFQQLCGINAIIFYAQSVFNSVVPSFPAGIASIILMVVQVVATVTSALLVDRFGRRILWSVSAAIMAVCLAIVGVHFFLAARKSSAADYTGYVAMVFINIYLVGFSLGAGPLAWMMLGELLPNSMKFLASVVAAVNWTFAFVVTIAFGPLVKAVGAAAIFWAFTVVCILGLLFVIFFMLETKDKTLEQIQKELAGTAGE